MHRAGGVRLLVRRLVRPGAPVRSQLLLLSCVPAFLVLAAAAELIVLPRSQWMPKLVGENAAMCGVFLRPPNRRTSARA